MTRLFKLTRKWKIEWLGTLAVEGSTHTEEVHDEVLVEAGLRRHEADTGSQEVVDTEPHEAAPGGHETDTGRLEVGTKRQTGKGLEVGTARVPTSVRVVGPPCPTQGIFVISVGWSRVPAGVALSVGAVCLILGIIVRLADVHLRNTSKRINPLMMHRHSPILNINLLIPFD